MKQKKKKQKMKNNSIFSSENEMAKLILLIIIVAVAFGLFYAITLLVVKKEKTNKTEPTTEATIQYKKILVSNILNQKDEEYYVLAYKNKDQYVEAYQNYLKYYELSKEDAYPYYYVELDNSLNKNYTSENSNLNTEKTEELKFSQTTLLRIKSGKIISIYEGKDRIKGKLERMTK